MKCRKHGELKENEYYTQLVDEKWPTLRCRLCNRESAAESKERRRDEVNTWAREDRKRNPEKYKEYTRRKRAKDPVGITEKEIARRRGITHQQYQEILEKQNNKCAICGNEERRMLKGKPMKLTLDHCHKTNKNREFLCHLCNVGLGAFNDDIDRMLKAVDYLRNHT